MADIQKIIDTTGTKLNKYNLKKADGTTEAVELTWAPGADTVFGSLFSAVTINPLVDTVNAIMNGDKSVNKSTKWGEKKYWEGTQAQYDALLEKRADTVYFVL